MGVEPTDSSREQVWALSPEGVYQALATSPQGLSEAEAAARLRQYGFNELPQPVRRHLLLRLLDQMTHFMALLLWTAGILAFVAGMPQLGWATWAVVLINAAFSFWQEYKAEQALDELQKMLPAHARVYRQGCLRDIPARELAPGDVVRLEEGDIISADARLTWSEGLYVDVSVLTGESRPVPRSAEALRGELARAPEAPNLVLAGTSVTSGRGLAVVFATATRTEFGRVAHLTATIQREPSPLEVEVARIVRIITLLAVGMGSAVFLLTHWLIGMEVTASFLFAIGIIVANVPEGLLPTVTLALATGVQRMARRNALIRRLSAVETLSATTVICTDKTGTLTENQMTACWLWIPSTAVAITGVGYAPEGEVRFPADAGAARQARLALAGFALCSDARLQPPENGHPWRIAGDPTEGALLVAARKAGLDPEALAAAAPRVREIPFEPRRKMMTVAVRWQTNDLWPSPAPLLSFTKGAPLELLARCRFLLRDGEVHPLSETERAEIVAANDRMARDGHRVLGLALRPGEAVATLPAEEVERELVFVGLAALMDPPRPEVPEAIGLCRQAGIAVTMVTGDYGLTAEAIGRRIGMVEGPATVISGADLDRLSDQQLEELLQTGSGLIFARALPEQKLRLVQAYQAMGHVVAVTGDGVNDAPALHAAHIGIAMGMSGTDVARAAADMVLVDDNFATIVAAVEQGRAVYSNIRKFMTYILASNVPEIVPFLAMAALRIPAALNILQILAVDLGTDMVPALALGAERAEEGVMRQPPRPKHRHLLDHWLLLRAYGFLGLIEAAAAMLAFVGVWRLNGITLADLKAIHPALLAGSAPGEVAALYRQATTAALAAIVACQLGNVFACRSEQRPLPLLRAGDNRLLAIGIACEMGLLLALAYVPSLQAVFQTAPLRPWQWLALLLCPLLMLAADVLWKRWRFRAPAP